MMGKESTFVGARLNRNSASGGSQRVTLSGGLGQGATQMCRFCRVQANSGNTEVVRIRISAAVIDGTTGVELPGNPLLNPYSVNDLADLYFYSADADAIVDIEYFN